MDTMDTTDTPNATNAGASDAGAKDEPKDPLSEPQIERFGGDIGPRNEIVIAQSPEGVVTALNGMNGAPLWRWKTGDPWAHVVYDGRQVYVSEPASDRPMWVEADTPPGWRPQGGPNDPRSRAFYIRTQLTAITAITAHDGKVLWRITRYIAGNSERIFLDGANIITTMLSFDSKALEVIALDCATGAMRWNRAIGPLTDPFGYVAQSKLLWAGAGSAAVALDTRQSRPNAEEQPTDPPYALLDSATGELTWRGAEEPAQPGKRLRNTWGGVVFRQEVHPSTWPHFYLCAVRESDGSELWRVPQDNGAGMLPRTTTGNVTAYEGQVFLLSSSDWAARVHALEASSGRVMWRWRSPRWLIALWVLQQAWRRLQEAQRTGAWQTLWGDAVRLRWRRPVRPNVWPALEVAHGRVYVATYLGVFARRAWDGHHLWHALPLKAANKLHVARDDREPATL